MELQLITQHATGADQAVFSIAMLLIFGAAHILAGTDWKRETTDLRELFGRRKPHA